MTLATLNITIDEDGIADIAYDCEGEAVEALAEALLDVVWRLICDHDEATIH